MRTLDKFLILSVMIIFPWALIRLANLETAVFFLLSKINIRDTWIVGLLIAPALLFLLMKWLFEPRSNVKKTDSGKPDIRMKTHK